MDEDATALVRLLQGTVASVQFMAENALLLAARGRGPQRERRVAPGHRAAPVRRVRAHRRGPGRRHGHRRRPGRPAGPRRGRHGRPVQPLPPHRPHRPVARRALGLRRPAGGPHAHGRRAGRPRVAAGAAAFGPHGRPSAPDPRRRCDRRPRPPDSLPRSFSYRGAPSHDPPSPLRRARRRRRARLLRLRQQRRQEERRRQRHARRRTRPEQAECVGDGIDDEFGNDQDLYNKVAAARARQPTSSPRAPRTWSTTSSPTALARATPSGEVRDRPGGDPRRPLHEAPQSILLSAALRLIARFDQGRLRGVHVPVRRMDRGRPQGAGRGRGAGHGAAARQDEPRHHRGPLR